jgi:hypothetical protein
MQAPPPGAYPPRFSALEAFIGGIRSSSSSNATLTPLHALPGIRRLFDGEIDAVETVAAAPDGTLGLVDKRGRVFIVTPDDDDAGDDDDNAGNR